MDPVRQLVQPMKPPMLISTAPTGADKAVFIKRAPDNPEVLWMSGPVITLEYIRCKLMQTLHWNDDKNRQYLWFKGTRLKDILIYLQVNKFSHSFSKELGNHIKRLYGRPPDDLKPEPSLKEPYVLRPYQMEGLRRILWKGNLLLALDQGLGKSLTAIASVVEGVRQDTIKKVLVVCPASLIRQWEEEIHKTSYLKAIIVGEVGKDERESIYRRFRDNPYITFLITNYDKIKLDLSVISEIPWDVMIIDEASKVKNPETAVCKAVRQIPRKWTIAASGTPMENSVKDLHTIVSLVEPGFLPPWPLFQAEYCYQIKGGKFVLNDSKKEELGLLLARTVLYARKKEEVAPDLPPKTVSTLPILFSAEERKIYQQLIDELTIKMGDEVYSLFSVFSKSMRQRQMCESWQLLDEEKPVSSKIKAHIDLVDSIPDDEQILIFSFFAEFTGLLSKYLKDSVSVNGRDSLKVRDEKIKRFKGGGHRILISSDILSYGVNLENCTRVINSSPWWNFARHDQREDRAHRLTSTKPVFVTKMYIDNSVEKLMWGIADLKKRNADAVLRINKKKFNKEEIINLMNGIVPIVPE